MFSFWICSPHLGVTALEEPTLSSHLGFARGQGGRPAYPVASHRPRSFDDRREATGQAGRERAGVMTCWGSFVAGPLVSEHQSVIGAKRETVIGNAAREGLATRVLATRVP